MADYAENAYDVSARRGRHRGLVCQSKVNRISTTFFGFAPVHPAQAMALALNRLTQQQAWAGQRLSQHAGKTVRIALAGFQLNWRIESDGKLAHDPESVTPDVTLEILLEKFSPFAFADQARRQDIAEYVHVSGQAALAQVMSDLARDCRPDPEDALSQWLGDAPARRIVQGVRQALSTVQTLGSSLTQNVAEYLSEETDALVGQPAMLTQRATQSLLLAALERLEHRQLRLESHIQKIERSAGAKS
jgi:ubiquinone biosynthesis protein UbiJ